MTRAAAVRNVRNVQSIASGEQIPETPRRLRVGMPHLDAGGLSENWLLRHAGELHWEAIGRRLGVRSDELCGAAGERLYPTFVAVRARYTPALAAVRENDVLSAAVDVVPCGRACAHGRLTVLTDSGFRADLELLSTFAVPERPGSLRMTLPAPALAARWQTAATAIEPPVARLARVARRGDARADGITDGFSGAALASRRPPLAELIHEPSPYTDYNGAGLLYFPAYVTIAETAERQLVRRLRLADGERAVTLSPARRDVFYYANLPLGEALVVELCEHTPVVGGVRTHLRVRRHGDGARMADVITHKVARA
jgi:probable biosynthetic protein (TIGR04098 family)